MQRIHEVPVSQAREAHGVVEGGLADHGASLGGLDLELEPRTSRQLHLRVQSQQPARLVRLDAPEVERVADVQLLGTRTPAAPSSA